MKAALVFLAAFWATASAAPVMNITWIATRECTQTPRPQQMSGVLSEKSKVLNNIQDCQQRCVDNDCVGFSHDGYYCRIFDWITTSFDTKENVTSWRCRAQLPPDNAQLPGFDIATVPAATVDQCSYKCDAFLGCYAYSWSSDNGGNCSLKSDKPATSVGPYDGSVLSGEVYKCGRPYFDMAFSGSDLSFVSGAVWTDCCAICRRATGCAGFTWSDDNDGTCYLKSKVTTGQFVAKPGATSAFMLQTPATTGPPPCTDTDTYLVFVGKTEEYDAPDLASCRELCLSTNCAAFTYLTTGCLMSDWMALSLYDPHDGYLCPGDITKLCSPSYRCRRQLPQENSSYGGLTITTIGTTDADRCSYKCDATPNCWAYSWSKANNGTCFLKSNKPAIATAPFDGSVVSGEAYKCTAPQFDQDVVGQALTSVQRPVWSDCCGVCRRTSGCDSFSWSSFNGGTCFLKTKTKRDRTKAAPGVVSAYIFTAPASKSTCTRSTRRLDGAVKREEYLNSRSDCQLLCQYYSCTGFFWDGSFCSVFAWVASIDDVPDDDHQFYDEYWWCRPQLPQVNGDYTGADLSNVPAETAAICSYVCEETYPCRAYTWSSGVCYMKTSKASAVTGPSDGSVVSGEVIDFYEVKLDYDINGKGVGSVQRETWPECKPACDATPGCSCFAWTNYNGGTCWLKTYDYTYGKEAIGVISAR